MHSTLGLNHDGLRKSALEVLGCSSGTKLLIIHADDLGMSHSVNLATFKAFEEQAISSASVMVPGPWFEEVARYAGRNDGLDLGIHLTVTSEWPSFKWRPLLGNRCPELVDGSGSFLPKCSVTDRGVEQVQAELSAQMDQARDAGLQPTHIDVHMLALLHNASLIHTYIQLGRDYGIPFLLASSWRLPVEHLLRDGDMIVDRIFSVRPDVPDERWTECYLAILNSMKPGLNQLTVHLGYDDAELQAVTAQRRAWGAAWRQRDYDVLRSKEFRQALVDQNIQMVTWSSLTRKAQIGKP